MVGPGNAGSCLLLPLNYLPRGPLYWSVQAVDGAYAGGPFAPEQVYQTSPPSISTISNLTLAPNLPAGPFPFEVGDGQTPRELLQWNVISYNETLVPASNVVISIVNTGAVLHVTPGPSPIRQRRCGCDGDRPGRAMGGSSIHRDRSRGIHA